MTGEGGSIYTQEMQKNNCRPDKMLVKIMELKI